MKTIETCPVCQKEIRNEPFMVREMVQNTREEFQYIKCNHCGVVYLVNPPKDMSRYYQGYQCHQKPAKTLVRIYYSMRKGLWRQIWGRLFPVDAKALIQSSDMSWCPSYSAGHSLNVQSLFGTGLKPDAKILDYGSGNGEFCREMKKLGWLCDGFDPYTDQNKIEQIMGNKYDLITLHHVFEHIANPLRTLKRLAGWLKPDGKIILRFPNVSGIGFEIWINHWWGLHAPRHYFLHTKKSLEIVAKSCGLQIYHAKCDSQYDHYLYSQEYYLGIHDFSKDSVRSGMGIFSKNDISDCIKRAENRNKNMVGDWICYYLNTI